MGFNGKHLSLKDRKIIEENINKGLRKFEKCQVDVLGNITFVKKEKRMTFN